VVTWAELERLLASNVRPRAVVFADKHRSYTRLAEQYGRAVVPPHSIGEYVCEFAGRKRPQAKARPASNAINIPTTHR